MSRATQTPTDPAADLAELRAAIERYRDWLTREHWAANRDRGRFGEAVAYAAALNRLAREVPHR